MLIIIKCIKLFNLQRNNADPGRAAAQLSECRAGGRGHQTAPSGPAAPRRPLPAHSQTAAPSSGSAARSAEFGARRIAAHPRRGRSPQPARPAGRSVL